VLVALIPDEHYRNHYCWGRIRVRGRSQRPISSLDQALDPFER
jgi:hypothetical protein